MTEKRYVMYDKNETLVFEGTATETARYLGLTYGSFKSGISRMRSGVNRTFKGGYTVYETEE